MNIKLGEVQSAAAQVIIECMKLEELPRILSLEIKGDDPTEGQKNCTYKAYVRATGPNGAETFHVTCMLRRMNRGWTQARCRFEVRSTRRSFGYFWEDLNQPGSAPVRQ